MNLIGKIFIVLLCLMALVFASFTVAVYATHKNWREVVKNPETGLEKQLELAKARTQELKDQRDRLSNELAAEKILKRDALAKLEGELAEKTQDLADRDKDLAAVERERDSFLAALTTAQEAVAAMRLEITGVDAQGKKVAPGLREEVRTAQEERDKLFAEVVKRTDDLNQKALEYQSLKERNVDLAGQFADASRVLSKFNLKPVPALYEGIPDDVDGLVQDVGAEGFIEISIGSDDGLLKGHTLEVYRQDGSAYLGRVEVTETSPNQAVCKVLPGFRRGPIQRGDHVTTTLR